MSASAERATSSSTSRPLVPTMNFMVSLTAPAGVSCIHVPRIAFLRRLPPGVERIKMTRCSGLSGQLSRAVVTGSAEEEAVDLVVEAAVSVVAGCAGAVRDGGRYGSGARSALQSMQISTEPVQWSA